MPLLQRPMLGMNERSAFPNQIKLALDVLAKKGWLTGATREAS